MKIKKDYKPLLNVWAIEGLLFLGQVARVGFGLPPPKISEEVYIDMIKEAVNGKWY